MKYSVLIIILSLISILAKADIPIVCGVQFGSSYSQAKSILDNKFNGGKDSYQLDENIITYNDITFAGEKFDYVDFVFTSDGNRSYLEEIHFYTCYILSDSKYAKAQRDRLFNVFKEKYEYRWTDTDENGYKGYILGYNPFIKSKGLILIETNKGKNKIGGMRLWTSVHYYCNGFVNIQDEI